MTVGKLLAVLVTISCISVVLILAEVPGPWFSCWIISLVAAITTVVILMGELLAKDSS